MAEQRIDYDWTHTAQILATLANCHRNPEKRRAPFTFEDFHPLRAARAPARQPLTGDILRAQAEAWRAARGITL